MVVLYTGHGFAGIIADKDDVNVYQMYPKNSTVGKRNARNFSEF